MSLINKEDLMQTLGITDMNCEKCGWYSRTARRCKRGSDFEDACCAIDDAPEVKPEPKWIPVSERLPEKETVLATVETKTFKHRYVCEAVWIPRWTWKASFDNWEDCSEYNEDEDEYYVLEGWYERVHNWDDYSYVGIEDDVIAWQPMPEPYREEGGE